MSGKYDRIINMPHHVSEKHPHMTLSDRATQFAPFAALTGYEEAVEETARLTDGEIDLDESFILELNGKIMKIKADADKNAEVQITYFVPDERKSGGAYITKKGRVKKVDDYEREIVMADGTRIKIDSIYNIM